MKNYLQKKILFASTFFISLFSFAQDSTFYVSFPTKLCFSLYQSQRSYNILFTPLLVSDTSIISAMNYTAEAKTVSGFELDYDKLSMSLSFKSVPGDEVHKGKTTYTNLSASIGGNKWIVSGAYRKYVGFYDNYSVKNDTTWNNTKPFYLNPSLATEGGKLRFMYFSRSKKFSFKSSYGCSYRQLKSSWSPVFETNFGYTEFSTDTSFFAPVSRKNYSVNEDLNALNVWGFSVGGGFSANIILFKRLYYNLTLIAGVESQWRNYIHTNEQHYPLNYLSLADDTRSSIGWNGKRFYYCLSTVNDISFYYSRLLQMKTTFTSVQLMIGYRIGIPDKGIVLKLKENKYYKML